MSHWKRASWFVGVLWVATVVIAIAQGGVGPIMNLQGRVDANNALVVSSITSGTQGPPGAIGNLRGKVDSNNALVVAMSGGTVGGTTFLAGDGTACTAPSYAFTSAPTTGMYLANANTTGFCGAGTAGPSISATQVNVPTNGAFRSNANGTKIQFPADGVITLLDNASTSFDRLQFGGTTASFPSLKRTGTGISVRLADDSGTAVFFAGGVSIGGGTPQSGVLLFIPTTFASLGTPVNGSVAYCSDCTIASPCASGGTGALAKRLNGVWVCN